MKTKTLPLILALFVVSIFAGSLAASPGAGISPWILDRDSGAYRQNPESGRSFVGAIRENANQFIDRVVQLEGTVGPQVQQMQASVRRMYRFEDGFGRQIIIAIDSANADEAAVEQRRGQGVVIHGVISLIEGEPVLTQPRLGPARAGGGGGVISVGGEPVSMVAVILFFAAVAVLLVVTLVTVMILRRGKSEAVAPMQPFPTTFPAPSPAAAPSSAAASPKPAANEDVGRTQKLPTDATVLSLKGHSQIAEPLDRTVKLLPGKLRIAAGSAAGKIIHLYSANTTIGRVDGSTRHGINHIGFDPEERSVSREQALLRYDTVKGGFFLRNLADPIEKNASAVDGRQLGANEEVALKTGSKLQFGTIELVFESDQP